VQYVLVKYASFLTVVTNIQYRISNNQLARRTVMKLHALIIIATAAAVTAPAFAQGEHYVNGYERRDGTYVQGHYQTNPDNTVNNNWSTQGNQNPYTGQYGTRPRDPNEPGY
jgi:hypothetical protein